MPSIGQQLLDVPFPQMIKSMGLAIAEAQFELDKVGLRMAQMMSGEYEAEEPDPLNPGQTRIVHHEAYVTFDGQQLSMLELGFTPSFYQFVDTVIEVKISLSMSQETAASVSTFQGSMGSFFVGFGMGATVSSVSASYSQKYNYSAEGSSLLRTKLAPVPPPPVLEQRIRKIIERRAAAEAGTTPTPTPTPPR